MNNPPNDALVMLLAFIAGTLYYYWYIFVGAGLLSWTIIYYINKRTK